MRIAEFMPESYQDYPKGLSSVIFTAGCNFACPACYARKIVNATEFLDTGKVLQRLERKQKYISKVVICGGEPTIQLGLVNFTGRLKDLGLSIKLDTNGSNFSVLEELKKARTVDYVAMDVKAPPGLYSRVAGKQIDLRDDVEKGISVVSQFPDYEFRTTVVPVIREAGISFMTAEEIKEIAKWIRERTGENSVLYLQQFQAKTKEEMLDERLAKENLPREMHETPQNLMEACLSEARKYLDARIR